MDFDAITNFDHPFIKITGKVHAIFTDVARGAYFGAFHLVWDHKPSYINIVRS